MIVREQERRMLSMARKDEKKHPYLRGYVFWLPILSTWINSPMYTDKAKEEFKSSLELMSKDKNLLMIEE
jgi:hypothetical protein